MMRIGAVVEGGVFRGTGYQWMPVGLRANSIATHMVRGFFGIIDAHAFLVSNQRVTHLFEAGGVDTN